MSTGGLLAAYFYHHGAAGHRTALTETTPLSGTTVTTYTYDAANRLTGAGIFTCNAAGQWVRAQSGNATLVYTYTADGLRVAQSSNGAGTPWKTW